jgi:sugar diacid utilization regulator
MGATASDERFERCCNLVRFAAASDSPEGLVVAASRQLRRPLVLFDPGGALLAAASPSAGLAQPAAALAAAITNRDESPAGWRIIPIERGRERLAVVAVGIGGEGEAKQKAMLDLALDLLGDQLERAALASAVRSERRAALVRRLVTDHAITTAEIQSKARAAGLRLADFYWPALLIWTAGNPGSRTLAEVDDEVQRQAPGSIAVALDNTTIALLVPALRGGAASREVHRELARLVRQARQLGHPDVRGIAGERSVDAARLPASVSELARLRRYLPHIASEAPVVSARSFDLERLLCDGLNRQRARAFVQKRLGPLLRHDYDHGTDLAHVLELALDFPRRDQAARASYMHRNTFRRHLIQALLLVEADLENPEDRLALHVAVKLRRAMQAPGGAPADGAEHAEGIRGGPCRAS